MENWWQPPHTLFFFLIVEQDRAACVLGLLGCLAGNQARDEGLGCSKLGKMVVLVLPLALSLRMDADGRLPRTKLLAGNGGVWSKSTTLVQKQRGDGGDGGAIFFFFL